MVDSAGQKVGIIGSGIIGRSWAMLFSSAGYRVVMYDIANEQLETALSSIKSRFDDLYKEGNMKGNLTPEQAFSLCAVTNNLAEAISEAFFIQECVPERVDLKQSVFSKIEPLMSDNAIVSSSTSSLTPSMLLTKSTERFVRRFVVSHPCNPPFYCPAVEVCPGAKTDPEVTTKTLALLREIGLEPVHVKKELYGFVLNNMQYALMNECFRLLEAGITDTEGIETIMRYGLGLRYACMGPMETITLNGDGIKTYFERFGEMIYNVSSKQGPPPRITPQSPVLDQIESELGARVPLDRLEERKAWRDRRLAALSKMLRRMDTEENE